MRLIDTSESWDALALGEGGELVVAITIDELAGVANAITEALRKVDDWEFSSLVGLQPSEAGALRDEISAILRSTFRPD